MSKTEIKPKPEEPFNSKAKTNQVEKIDYEKELYDILEMIADIGLQMQNVSRNTKLRLKQSPQNQTQ